MLPTNTNFDAKHALDYKTPLYLIHFDGETTDYCNHKPGSPANTLKQHLVDISGLAQKVTPEEGRSSVGGVKVGLLDKNDEITALLATDSYYFHRRKTTVKAGYAGMTEADLLTIMVGWVTGLSLSPDGLVYNFALTDPQKWMQRKIFRDATEASPTTLQGNPINILLAVLTSTGAGTNGDYDWYAAADGLGIDDAYINVAGIEDVRDKWFPGDSNYMKFTIEKRIKAKDWLEKEIFKVLNLYPVVDGDGRFSIKPFKPPLPAIESVQSFDEGNIIGIPRWDANLSALVNEIELHYNWDPVNDEFDNEDFYIDSTSLDNRGPGKKPIVIKSKGFHTDLSPSSIPDRATDNLVRRKNKIFGRFAIPPAKISFSTFFSRWLSEAGDVVPFSHPLVPDIVAGTRGLTNERMEIINRTVNWKKGTVKIDLLDTGFAKSNYAVISPCMTVTSGVSDTVFNVSSADAAKYQEGWKIDIFDAGMRAKATNLEITDITGGQITVGSSIGATPVAGWVVQFSTYANLTADQQYFWAIRATGAHLIVP